MAFKSNKELLEELKALDPDTKLTEANKQKEIVAAIEAAKHTGDEGGTNGGEGDTEGNAGAETSVNEVPKSKKQEDRIFFVAEYGMNVKAKNSAEAAAKAKRILEGK